MSYTLVQESVYRGRNLTKKYSALYNRLKALQAKGALEKNFLLRNKEYRVGRLKQIEQDFRVQSIHSKYTR